MTIHDSPSTLPIVSVIIPNYNHAPYLEQRIETVLAQTYRHFEVIILDDCSTDNSREVIEKYRDHEKVSGIYYSMVNSGSTFRQWVKGIELCTGEYVWIAESDDWCEASFLNELVTGLAANDNCVVGYCQSYCIQGTNKIKWQSGYSYLNAVEKGPDFIHNQMLSGTAIFNASMAIWKRDTFRLISKEFMNYRFCGDWLFWIELCRHGNVFISGKHLNYFRKHAGDVSGKAIQQGVHIVEELEMFRLLYSREWISHVEFTKTLQTGYVHYKAVELQLTPGRRKEIERLFFTEQGLKPALRSFYIGYYAKYMMKKVFNRLVR